MHASVIRILPRQPEKIFQTDQNCSVINVSTTARLQEAIIQMITLLVYDKATMLNTKTKCSV